MRCATCGFECSEGLQFCGQCGARLAAVCSSCGRSNPPSFRFCGSCGAALAAPTEPPPPSSSGRAEPKSYTPPHLAAKILTGRSAIEGERKQVTVLFADVAGFTALAERLDPEAVHALMDRCFAILMEEVHRYEGTVNQFTGDGIMALFGAPIALENAPERAIRAALGIQASLGRYAEELRQSRNIQLRMRIGIHTGPVVVGKIGDDLRMDYTAVGDTTNLAARLQQAAEPGTILVSEHMVKLVGERLVARPVGPLLLKGKSDPVSAYEVSRVRARAPLVAPSERGLTPLVGRRAELATLEALFEQASRGRGQMAFVVGEAGIGKSRLIYEFRRRLAGRDVAWLEGRCVSFAREIPLLPVIDVVKASFGIDEADGEAAIIEKVRGGIQELDPSLDSSVPYLRYLLAVDPGDASIAAADPHTRRFAVFDALKRLTIAAAARRPLAVLIEDLHWIDQPSEEYLTYIAEALATARVLLLCTYRPGYRNPFGERSYTTRLALQPLSQDETATMAASVLEAREFPAEIRDLIIHKAEGNPFFVEEVAKSLLEMGVLSRTPQGFALNRDVSEVVIPDTIQDVIMARIDRLGEAPKRAIQIASVIGREFAVRLLERVSDLGGRLDKLVGELRALELIYEKSGFPELAYMFKHALTHDVAYESLLVARRKELHRVIGQAIEELYADRLPEYWEVLAHHFYRGEDWPRAFDYLLKAADKARGTFANGEALYFYKRALEAAEHLDVSPEARAKLLEGKGQAHFALSEFAAAIEAFRQALELAATDSRRVRLEAYLAYALLWHHELDAALSLAEGVVRDAEQAGEFVAAAEALFSIGMVRAVRGDLERAEQCLPEAFRLAAAGGARAVALRAQGIRGILANWRGDYRAAVDVLEPVIRELKERKELADLVMMYSQGAISLGGAGEYERALGEIADGIAVSESIGDKVWRARMWNTRGWILGEIGSWKEAEEANSRSIEIAKRIGPLQIVPELLGNSEANLADLALARGDFTGVEPHLAAVSAILSDRRNDWMTWRYGMHAHAVAAELCLARGDLARSRERILACLATAEQTRSRKYLVRGNRLLAAWHVAEGNLGEAERLLARVVEEARALGNPPQLWHALLAYGRVLHSLGRREEAGTAWREAFAVTTAVTDRLPAEAREGFRGSPLFTAIGELGA